MAYLKIMAFLTFFGNSQKIMIIYEFCGVQEASYCILCKLEVINKLSVIVIVVAIFQNLQNLYIFYILKNYYGNLLASVLLSIVVTYCLYCLQLFCLQ